MCLFQRDQLLAVSEMLLYQSAIDIWLSLNCQCRREPRQGKSGYPEYREQMHDGWLTGSLVEEELFDRIYSKILLHTYTHSLAHGGAEGRTARSPFTGLIRSCMCLTWPHRHTPMNILIPADDYRARLYGRQIYF
jgi:hypothetical protein